jgi:Tfp pilus assembly protein PilN
MTAQKKSQINLLPQKGFSSSTTGRILLWILSTFRIIVIVTEIVVMGAFLSRFWLDAQNTDLSDEIKEKQVIISSFSTTEKDFKITQKRLAVFSSLIEDKNFANTITDSVVSRLPSDTYLTGLKFTPEGLILDGTSPSERSIQQFLINLQAVDEMKNIRIQKIVTDEDTGFLNFTFNADTASKEAKK